LGIFMFFMGVVAITDEYQEELKLKEGLLVGFFLAGLVVLGTYQRWWLEPTLGGMGELPLFLGATGLTAITDNAALTYLGYVAGLEGDFTARFALVAGAVAGGGLTVIANAPNPAGFGILKGSFGETGISPLGLLAAATGPTVVAMICLWFLPNL
jgi:predicted cation transporter